MILFAFSDELMCPAGNPSAWFLARVVPGHFTCTVLAAPLAHPPAAAPWRAGIPLCQALCSLQHPSSLFSSCPHSLRRGQLWGCRAEEPPPRAQLCRGAGGQLLPKINTEGIRDHLWVHQAPGLPEDDAFPSHRARPEAERAVLDRRMLFAGSSIPCKAWHNTRT